MVYIIQYPIPLVKYQKLKIQDFFKIRGKTILFGPPEKVFFRGPLVKSTNFW